MSTRLITWHIPTGRAWFVGRIVDTLPTVATLDGFAMFINIATTFGTHSNALHLIWV